jgi:hypothetical protein
MKKLWHDIQAHRCAAELFLVYWLATLAVIPITWAGGTPTDVPLVALLMTIPLIAGALVGRWRASTPERVARSGDRISGGMLAGVLSAEITFFVIPVVEVIRWMHRHKSQGGEVLDFWGDVLEFSIVTGIFGVLLGLAGAMLAIVMGRFRRHGRPIPST